MEAQKKWALQKCHQELRTDIILANFWPACRKLLTEVEYLWIASKTNNVSAVDELVEILLTKTDREFDGFCEILNANGYEHWAKKLRESAQDKEGGVHGEPEPLKMDNSRVTSTLNGSGARPEGFDATGGCLPVIPDIKVEYIKVKEVFVNVCTTQGIPTLDQLKVHCISLIECAFQNIPGISRRKSDIEKATTLLQLARVVCFRLSSWVSYDFFKKVIAHFQPALEIAKMRLTHYEDQLKPLLQQKLDKIAELQQREDSYEVPENMAEFAVKYKLDADGLQVNDLIAQKDFLAQRLGVPEHLLQVLSWERGSVVITYRIMRDVLPLAELALYREDARAELTQNGVVDVFFASHTSEQPGLVDQPPQTVHLQRRTIVTVLDAHCQDLDTTSLTSDLKGMGILTEEQYQKLASLDDERKHEALLYTLLAHDGPDTYDKLVECVGKRSTSIAADLQDTLEEVKKSPGALSVIGSSQATFKDVKKLPGALSVISSSQAVEAALADHCWIPFGVQSHYVGPEGKRLYLQTSVNAMEMKEEEGIFLEVPPGAISPSKSVEIHSAIIPNGSFTLPEGYQLGSMVVYINYDNKRVTQLLRLHLPHWYGGEDHVRDGLSFAMAPHVLKEGELEYHFELLEGGTFTEQQQCGVLQISGHCTLFAAVFKVKVSSFYYASLWTHQKSDLNFWIRVVVTYADPVWIEVLAKYWEGWSKCQGHPTVCFQFSDESICGELAFHEGEGWQISLAGTGKVHERAVVYHELLESAVKKHIYPPAIHCNVSYSSPPDCSRGVKMKELYIKGTNEDRVVFLIKVHEASSSIPPMEATFTEITQAHAKDFLSEMNCKGIAPVLKSRKLIPAVVGWDILQSRSREEANTHLFDHLVEDADKQVVLKIFKIATEAEGYGRMNTFATLMLRKLQGALSPSAPVPADGAVAVPRASITPSEEKPQPVKPIWRKVVKHIRVGGKYGGVAVNSGGLLAVTDDTNECVHLLGKDDKLVRSIGKGVLGNNLGGVAFDLKGNVWVVNTGKNNVVNLSQKGEHLHTISHADGGQLSHPGGISVSQKGLIYICDYYNHRVTVHDEESKFRSAFGSQGSGPKCFKNPRDVAFGSDGLLYVTDEENSRVCVWCEEGTHKRGFETKYTPTFIATTSDDHLMITSYQSNIVMVYTLEGELVREFGERGSEPGKLHQPYGICIDDNGQVFVADYGNNRIQVFS